ncbi:TPT-domain-containing protein [Leucogyrophana mollusca]|uniref:TPT-domain-containing protein n=1 Tax=Leucogyrophana mollusca TaxID=85980 RepID=A0ACB8B5K7_9AGAM|nr:TPT-domain-containing protein [Leucogyrophana mollusca]
MHFDRVSTELKGYDPYTSSNYNDFHPVNGGEAWRATSPHEKPISALRGTWSVDASYARSTPFSIFSRLRKIASLGPSNALSLPSLQRRSHGPLTSPSASSMASTTRFVLLCGFWYTTSALSSNTGKAILTQFSYPVTLTIIQFGFVATYCLILMIPSLQFSKLRPPTSAIIRSTLPMGMFQVGGHMFSSMAISRINVSTVHTIKALSPLFTVAAYALLFGVRYSPSTYISLLPLTIGVMLACTFDVSASSPAGLLCAFGSALVFVSSNIFFKKIMPSGSQTSSHKLDKLNLLLYSSGMAFILMIPIWSFTDLPRLLAALDEPTHAAHPTPAHSVPYYLFMNGTVHFAQNIIAFVILSSTSPVTYSIASLIKRVAVICIAIVWFSQSVHPIQGLGIGMTFVGLYMYNTAKRDVERGEHRRTRVEATRDMMLPTNRAEEKMLNGSEPPSPRLAPLSVPVTASTTGMGPHSAGGRPRIQLPPPHHPADPSAHLHTNLPIQISPTTASNVFSKRNIVSPTDSYPSPPPSLDSPPSKTGPLAYASSYPHAHAHQQLMAESLTAARVSA